MLSYLSLPSHFQDGFRDTLYSNVTKGVNTQPTRYSLPVSLSAAPFLRLPSSTPFSFLSLIHILTRNDFSFPSISLAF